MKSKLLLVLTALTLIVSACATPTTEAPKPTTAPTQVAAATTAPTTAPTVAPTTAPTVAATATSGTPRPPTATVAPTATPIPPAVTAAPNAVKVQFWHYFTDPTQTNAIQRFADKFNAANPTVYIQPSLQGNIADLNKKANAAIQAKSVPDMITGNPGDLFDYNTSGAMVSLDEYINDPKDGLTKEQLADITTPDLYFDKIGGKTYGISLGRSALVMFYNEDMLKAAGFTKAPETWDDFDKVCAAVTKGDTYCYPFAASSADTSSFASWVFSRGGNYAAADEKTAVFTEAAGLDALKWLKNQADKGWGKVPTVTSRGDQADFGNGKVAFAFGSTAGLPFFQDAVNGRKDAAGNPAPFKWNVAPLPAGPKGKQVVDIFGPSIGILKTTPERQKAAWLFLKSLLQKDQQMEWAQRLVYFPATKSAMDELLKMDDAKAKEVNPRFALTLAQYKTAASFMPLGRREPLSPAWQGVRGIIVNMLTAVFTNKSGADFKATDPEGALKEGVDRVNKALSEYGK